MGKEIQEDTFFGITEIAERLKLSQKTIRKHIASGELKSVNINGVYKVPVDALNDFIKQNEIQNEEIIDSNLSRKKIFKKEGSEAAKKAVSYKNKKDDAVNWIDIIDDWENV